MNLLSVRIITAKFNVLVEFYEHVTGLPGVKYTADFAEIKTPNATIAIGSTKTLQLFGGDTVAQPAQNRSVFIEFRVDDVEKDYEGLAEYLQNYIVQKPTLMPWGNRSFLFRDPDGNLINFFTPVAQKQWQSLA